MCDGLTPEPAHVGSRVLGSVQSQPIAPLVYDCSTGRSSPSFDESCRTIFGTTGRHLDPRNSLVHANARRERWRLTAMERRLGRRQPASFVLGPKPPILGFGDR